MSHSSLPNNYSAAALGNFSVSSQPSSASEPVVDRRTSNAGATGGERRQFGSAHNELTDNGRQLAIAIDQYKLEHHRRYITCDEMLTVIEKLGYSK
ncbi:hypothetical protein Pla52o_03760 [Novipirellula galeiformis]|uniref:Uncharacterized protein n=1 Tax=Novipirellula galeiformis TaxID=2528004 RepID=A0A5C6CNH9_9BACT|nr:hypothetical protein [Novipirellula galeiformis]TWU26523.1 hypothetical protein Pla52o_03760 [Novipirellula galeiformis]